MALIREMFGLSVTLVSQGCLLPLEEDPVGALTGPQLPTHALPRTPSPPYAPNTQNLQDRCVRDEHKLLPRPA